MPNAQVNITGLKETLKVLKEADADYSKEIQKRIRTAAGRVLKDARDDAPSGNALRNWGSWGYSYTYKRGSRKGQSNTRGFDFTGTDVRRNMKTTRASMRKRGAVISNYLGLISNDPAGIIWQTAGKGSSRSAFVMNLLTKYSTKRGIWKAYDRDAGAATREIEAAARDAERAVQKILNVTGGK